jgi:hypothetical protein
MSAGEALGGEALAAVTTIYKVVAKVRSHSPRNRPSYSFRLLYAQVKDNKDELMRVSRRLEHIILSVEDSRRRDVIREDEYNDALTAISESVNDIALPFSQYSTDVDLLQFDNTHTEDCATIAQAFFGRSDVECI